MNSLAIRSQRNLIKYIESLIINYCRTTIMKQNYGKNAAMNNAITNETIFIDLRLLASVTNFPAIL